jgi:serine-type D-Ala-D-Ala carboxypeptidase/endopeptidase
MLGEALGQHLNTSYATVLRDRLLAPLGMSSTGLPGESSVASVTGYDDAMVPVPPFSSGVFDPAGGAISTAADLLSLADAYLGRGQADVVEALALAANFTVSDPASGRPLGLGWDLMEHDGRMLLTKDGSAAGYNAFVVIDVDKDRAVVVLSNGQGAVRDLALLVLDPRLKVRALGPVVTIEPEDLQPLVGVYEGGGTGDIHQRRRQALFSVRRSSGAYPSLPRIRDAFRHPCLRWRTYVSPDYLGGRRERDRSHRRPEVRA